MARYLARCNLDDPHAEYFVRVEAENIAAGAQMLVGAGAWVRSIAVESPATWREAWRTAPLRCACSILFAAGVAAVFGVLLVPSYRTLEPVGLILLLALSAIFGLAVGLIALKGASWRRGRQSIREGPVTPDQIRAAASRIPRLGWLWLRMVLPLILLGAVVSVWKALAALTNLDGETARHVFNLISMTGMLAVFAFAAPWSPPSSQSSVTPVP